MARANPLAFLVAAGLLIGLGNREVRRFERDAAKEILSKLSGPEAKVTVRAHLNGLVAGPLGDLRQVVIRASNFTTEGMPLFTEPERSKKGFIRELRIELDDFELAGLRIAHLEASIPDCRFDYALAVGKRVMRLSRSGLGTGTVRVRQDDLGAYILRKFPEIKNVRVRIEKDRAFVEGSGEFLIVKTNFYMIARLEPRNGVELVLTDAHVFFDGLSADEESKRVLLKTLNPVIDLDKDLHLFGAIHIEGLMLEEGLLEAWGGTRIPDRP